MLTGDSLDDVHRHVSAAMLALALHLDGRCDVADAPALIAVARALSAAQEGLTALGRRAADVQAARAAG